MTTETTSFDLEIAALLELDPLEYDPRITTDDSIFWAEPPLKNDSVFQTPPLQEQSDTERYLAWLDLPSYTFCWSVNHSFQNQKAQTYTSIDDAAGFCSSANENKTVTAVWVGVNPPTADAPVNAKLKNASIIERHHLVFDLDPDKDYTATAENKAAVSSFINMLLISFGFESIAQLDSGNGALILAKITAPVKDGWDGKRGYIQRFYNFPTSS